MSHWQRSWAWVCPSPSRRVQRAEAGRREHVEPNLRRHFAQGGDEQPADDVFADVIERPHAALLAAAEQRVDDLEEQVFEEIAVFLVNAGRDEHLPGAVAAVLDGVEQVGLARALVAQDRHDFRMGHRIVAIEIDDAEQQVALGGVKFGNVVACADLVVRIAREVIAERVPGPPERLRRGNWPDVQ